MTGVICTMRESTVGSLTLDHCLDLAGTCWEVDTDLGRRREVAPERLQVWVQLDVHLPAWGADRIGRDFMSPTTVPVIFPSHTGEGTATPMRSLHLSALSSPAREEEADLSASSFGELRGYLKLGTVTKLGGLSSSMYVATVAPRTVVLRFKLVRVF